MPGAEAGTVTVLDHGGFRIVAQLGFRDEILGNAFGPVGQRDWYGGRDEDYLTGRPRISPTAHREAETAKAHRG